MTAPRNLAVLVALASLLVALACSSDDGGSGGADAATSDASSDPSSDVSSADGGGEADAGRGDLVGVASQVAIDEFGNEVDLRLEQYFATPANRTPGPIFLSVRVSGVEPLTFAYFISAPERSDRTTNAVEIEGVAVEVSGPRFTEPIEVASYDTSIEALEWTMQIRSRFDESIPCVINCTGGCETGETMCGGACVDTRTDPAHCGACDTTCDPNARCNARSCVCELGWDRLGDGSVCEDWTDVSIAGGGRFSCAISAGEILCWGHNEDARLTSASTDQTRPIDIAEPGPWRMLDVGSVHSCAIKESGELWCWGAMGPRLGRGPLTPVTWTMVAEKVGDASDWTDVTADGVSCGVRAGGELWCWGRNLDSIVGVGDDDEEAEYPLPQRIGTESDWELVDAGGRHACGIRAGGELWCWGNNRWGQLGVGESGVGNKRAEPARVGEMSDWVSVSAGPMQTCGIRGDGELWCWGGTEDGTIPTGRTDIGTTPQLVRTSEDGFGVMASVHVGSGICAVDAEGARWCLGENDAGQLGNLTEEPVTVMSRIGEHTDWVAVNTGMLHGCGVRANGSLWCWGTQADGNIGIGDPFPDGQMVDPTPVVAPCTERPGEARRCGFD